MIVRLVTHHLWEEQGKRVGEETRCFELVKLRGRSAKLSEYRGQWKHEGRRKSQDYAL